MKNWIFFFIASILAAFFLGAILNIFILQSITVDGYSMAPTLKNGENLLINKLPYTINRKPNYGDIIAFDSRLTKPHTIITDVIDFIKYNQIVAKFINNGPVYRIKRVIGMPGDTLEFKNENVLRNGIIINEPYISIYKNYSNEKVIVPQNHIFVMGDNRNNSVDSRDMGSIPLNHVIGKYILKF